jgi:predicted P-loop ATPase
MNTIRRIIRWWQRLTVAIYSHPIKSGHLSGVSEKKQIAKGVRMFFEHNYELRFNTLKQIEEFRKKPCEQNSNGQNLHSDGHNDNSNPWNQLTDRELKRIAIEQMEQVGVAWSIDIELYVHSAFVPEYNPVIDFLQRCKNTDETVDFIRSYAQRVPTNFVRWPDFFHRWFLGMVAQWLNLSRDFGNGVIPMLIGGQGTHKSTFCRLLLPPELREYYVDDIKLDNAEQVERMLSRMLLVNIDEYNAKTDREQAKIKRVVTEKDIQTRRMRSDQYVMRPRMASFIATTNDREPLNDPTGNRRYLCCEVTGIIDTESPIPYSQLYAQAVTELKNGATWYFTKAEEAEIERHNQDYRCQSTPETILLAYFAPAERRKENFMRAIDILDELRQHVRTTDLPSIKTLTMALKSCHFPHGKINGQRGWYARKMV